MDYSQSGEEAHILAWAQDRPPGRFLDLGAADGATASNTRALALLGWSGVLVEPAASQFDRLAALYRERPDISLVQAAVTTGIRQPLVGFHYSRDLVSTTEQSNADTWAEITEFVRCYVAAIAVHQLLYFFPPPYDLVSVDTEGTSIELWNELRERDAFAPGALAVVEAEDGGERWLIQDACKDGWARLAVTPNNVLLSRL